MGKKTNRNSLGEYVAWDEELKLKEWIELLDRVLRALLYMLKLIRLSTKFSFIGPIQWQADENMYAQWN